MAVAVDYAKVGQKFPRRVPSHFSCGLMYLAGKMSALMELNENRIETRNARIYSVFCSNTFRSINNFRIRERCVLKRDEAEPILAP